MTKPKHRTAKLLRSSQGGFSMVEILVTFLIVTLALLGVAGLQGYSMRMNQSGQFRGQAVYLAGDLAERMQANLPSAKTGNYNVSTNYSNYSKASPSNSCTTNACNDAELALYDLALWQNSVVDFLPQSTWSVTSLSVGSLITTTVTLSWFERADSKPGSTTSNPAVTASYTATRLFIGKFEP